MADKYGPHVERLHAVAASPSRKQLAIAGERELRLSGSRTVETHVHVLARAAGASALRPECAARVDGAVYALVFATDELLLAGTGEGAIVGWDPTAAGTGDGGEPKRLCAVESAHRGAVRALATDPTGQIVASVGDDGVLRLFAVSPGRGQVTLDSLCSRRLSGRPLRAVAIDVRAGGDAVVAAAGDDGIIRALPVEGAESATVREMTCGQGDAGDAGDAGAGTVGVVGAVGIGALCFTGDGRIAAGCADGSIHLCHLEGAVDAENRSGDAAHTAPVRGLVYGPELFDDGNRPLARKLFSIGEDGELKAWVVDTRRRPKTTKIGTSALLAMTWIAAGRGSKPDKRGGQLAIVNRGRRLVLVTLDENQDASESFERLRSHFDQLREDLKARADQVRAQAIDALATLEEDEARALLDRALGNDKKPDVRARAAGAIGRSGRRLSRPALRQALDDSDKGVRKAALAALDAIEADAPLAPVRAALGSRHADMRIVAVKRLPGLRAASPLVPGLVADALRDSSAEVRMAALDALYALSDAGSVDPVRTAMARGPADIRVEALLRLGRARKTADPVGRVLLEGALDDDDADVRGTAFLVAVGARARLAPALRAVDPDMRVALDKAEKDGRFADAASDLPSGPGAGAAGVRVPDMDDGDLQPLFAALTCRHADTALRAARCLGLLADPRATGALLQLSREPDADVRRHVAEAVMAAAGAMPTDARLIARLEWLLDDPNASVRAAAFDALQELGEPDGAPALLDLAALALRCKSEDIRLRALPILVKFGGGGEHAKLAASQRALGERADALLGDALDDENARVRGEAFGTLWAWHGKQPELPLRRGTSCRHADVRVRVVTELTRLPAKLKATEPGAWGDQLLLDLVDDASERVGLAAYKALTGDGDAKGKAAKSGRKRIEVHRAAMNSPRPAVRAAGCKGALKSHTALRDRIVVLIRDEHPVVHIAAIEALDRIAPEDAEGFALALGSIFYDLRARACELLGKRRDTRAIAPAMDLLTIPDTHINRPSDAIRQRVARALADVGDAGTIPFYVSLLDDADGVVREMGARGLATSCRPGHEQPLIDALSHDDLPVRSWVAEGLARLGDPRAVPVLAGTLVHDHLPIRKGAIMGFVALGPDGVRGILQGLDDANREIQDLVFAVVVARDVALARAGLAPDLLLSAMSSLHPEIRFAAARILEARMQGEEMGPLAMELVGPRKPDRASDMKDWPDEAERAVRLQVLVSALASDHPAQRYAAAQVLTLRGQPKAFWREADRLIGPTAANRPRIPYTNWEDDERWQPRKRGWIRALFRKVEAPAAESATERVLTVVKFAGAARAVPPGDDQAGAKFDVAQAEKLAFGVYAGLVRQAPVRGESDETHRVRRDSIERLAALGRSDSVGRDAVLPVLRRALSDPHHLVRKAALAALRSLYDDGALEPLRLALAASAADVGRGAVDELVAAAVGDGGSDGSDDAAALVRAALDAPAPEVRAYAMTKLPRLYPADSLEPWLLALSSQHADVRLSVVDRLVDSTDARVSDALGRAMESDHDDLRLKAAVALARRGDVRTVDILAGILRSEDAGTARAATEALVSLAHARPTDPKAPEVAAAAASAIAARIEDDPDNTADRPALIRALGRIGSPAAGEVLLALMRGDLPGDDARLRALAFDNLLEIARDRDRAARVSPDGARRAAYDEPLALAYVREAAGSTDQTLRARAIAVLRDIDDAGAEDVLARLIEDRDEDIRVAACEAFAFRVEHVPGATLDVLAQTLRAGRRELVLPAAAGLASRGRGEALQALILVFKAGEQGDRERAVLAMGTLGDRRALEEIEPLIDPRAELEDDDRALVPAVIEALGRILPRLEGDEQARVRKTVEHAAVEGMSGVDDARERALIGLRHAGDDRSRSLIERIAADRYEDEGVRAIALRELGLLGDERSESVLADALGDDDWTLRRTALEALNRVFPRDRTRVSLFALGSEHTDVSEPAAAFLARRGDPAVLVARMSEIESEEVRVRLRQGLVRRGVCPTDELRDLLSGERTGARARAAADAAWIAGAAAGAAEGAAGVAGADRAALAGAVATSVALSRAEWTAAKAGARPLHDDHDGGQAWRRLSAAEEAWRASLWAAERLGADIGDEARAAASDAATPASVRVEAVRWLAARGGPGDVSVLQARLSDPDPDVRAAAGGAVAALAPEQAPAVLSGLAVADAAALGRVAEAALDRAGRSLLEQRTGRQVALPVVLGSKRIAELCAIAESETDADDDQAARLVAIASLGRIGGERAEASLRRILDAPPATGAAKKRQDAARAAAFRALRRAQRADARRRQYEEVSR